MKKILYCLYLIIIWFCFACNKGKNAFDPYVETKFINALYSNPNGNNPLLIIDTTNTSEGIQYPSTPFTSFTSFNGKIFLNIPNIRFQDKLGIYNIDDNLTTEVYKNNKWSVDQENKLVFDKKSKIDVVLVLDLSTSLGIDVDNVKQYATNFINNVIQNLSDSSRVGLIIFSAYNNIQMIPLTRQINTLSDPINSYVGDSATALYAAIDKGITMLKSSSVENKALVVFTDGYNNDWQNEEAKYRYVDTVLNHIERTTFSTYTIGFTGKGNLEDDILKKLAFNGGVYAFPSSSDELSNVFNIFFRRISSTYSFIYTVNSGTVASSSPLQIRFKIKTTLQ
jgi:Mg-chelatase subunit ChlD